MPTAADRLVDRYRRRHHGLVTAGAARQCGLSTRTIRARVRAGTWLEVQPLTYVEAGCPDSRELRLNAAVLAVDAGTTPAELEAMGRWTALSHLSAAAHLGADGFRHPDRIHVTTNGRGGRELNGVVVHRTRHLPPGDVVNVARIPTTSATRTVCDCAALHEYARTRRLLAELTRTGHTDPAQVLRRLETLGRVRGAVDVRRACEEVAPWERWSRAEVESVFVRGIVAHRLPRPVLNHGVVDRDGRRRFIDAAFVRERVPIEIVSRRWHGLPTDADDDAARDRAIVLTGWHGMLRFTYWEVMRRMDDVARTVATALDAAHRNLELGLPPVG